MRFSNFINVVSVFIWVAVVPHKAASEPLQAKLQRYIIDSIACGVDAETYERFHHVLEQSSVDSEDITYILDQSGIAQQWQQSFWDSAYQSVTQKKVVRTPEYQAIFAKLNREVSYKAILDKSERTLAQIAAGQPIQLPAGMQQFTDLNQIILDEATTKFIREHVGIATDRLRSLVSKNWPPKQYYFTYPEQNLHYYSDVRLAIRALPQQHELIKQWESLQAINCSSTFSLLIEDFSAARELQLNNNDYINHYQSNGMQLLSATSGTWHGYPYDETILTYVSQGQKTFEILRTVIDNKSGFNYLFSVTSLENSVDAASSLASLLMRFSFSR